MDYKKEVGRRLKLARDEKGWTLRELEAKTPGIDLKRINAYENGDRMPRQSEAVILGHALGKRAAWIMAVDDVQLPISLQEEALIRSWRTLPERERMEIFRKVETLAMAYRDPVSDQTVETHFPAPRKVSTGKAVATKKWWAF